MRDLIVAFAQWRQDKAPTFHRAVCRLRGGHCWRVRMYATLSDDYACRRCGAYSHTDPRH